MLTTRFQQLDNYLGHFHQLWQFTPFVQDDYPWRTSYPSLADWLDEQPEQSVRLWQAHPEQLIHACSVYIPGLRLADDLVPVPHQQHVSNAPFWLKAGIKGRKWQQISAFSGLITAKSQPIVEWCAGKGHLGRLLAWQDGCEVLSLEWQEELCQQGQVIAEKLELRQQFHCLDVLKQSCTHYLQRAQQVVALHACGQLHITMLEQAVENKVQEIRLCPCCYQLIPQAEYHPLSQLAQKSKLRLSRQDLRLAVQETVTAHQRERDKRQVERCYRQIFDIWQRRHLGQNQYLSIPSAPDSLFRQPPLAFCLWAARQKGLAFDGQQQLPELTQMAEHRLGQVDRMELIQHMFRRHLELWLVLDRCLYLQENGYETSISTFCAHEVTPRNLAIRASLKA